MRKLMKPFQAVLLISTLVAIVWLVYFGGGVLLSHAMEKNRVSVYQSLAGLFGTLLGFTIAAASIMVGYAANEKLTFLREVGGFRLLWRIFFSTIRALSLATVTAVLGLIFDTDTHPTRIVLYACVVTTTWATLWFGRCIFLFEQLVVAAIPDKKASDD